MGFMKGRAALRRTVQYLEKGDINLRNSVKILAFQFNTEENIRPYHEGLSKFVFWHLPQLKYKNPNVQFVTMNNLTPTPWIQVFFENSEDMLIDCDSHSRMSIHEHVKKVLGKTEAELQEEMAEDVSITGNPANFGPMSARQCLCEVPGQVPCPGYQPLPKEMTGKYQRKMKREAEDR